MKNVLLVSIFLTGCVTIKDIVPPFDNPYKVNETNYMKTPCVVDGATVKKKPKVEGIVEDLNTPKRKNNNSQNKKAIK